MFNLLDHRETSKGTEWRWSDSGRTFSGKRKWEIVPVAKAKELVEKDPSKVYCFVTTTDDDLLIENCSTKHAYICEGSEGKEFINYNPRFQKTQLKLSNFTK